jgi:hypothetical protein
MLAKEARVENLRAANAKKTAVAQEAVLQALQRLSSKAAAVNINAVAEEAGVSRGFIYSQPELRANIDEVSKLPRTKVRSAGFTPNQASLTARLETALDTIKELKADNRELKQRIENLSAQLLDQKLAN